MVSVHTNLWCRSESDLLMIPPPLFSRISKHKLLISLGGDEIMHATRVFRLICVRTLTGKSALLRRFTENAFRQEGQEVPDREEEEGIKSPTLQRSLDVDGKQVNLVLSDTNGQECFGHVTCSLYQGMNGACSTSHLSVLSLYYKQSYYHSLCPFGSQIFVLFFIVVLCFDTTERSQFLNSHLSFKRYNCGV